MTGLISRTDPIRFWALVDELIATSEIVIDRPGGSAHPRVPEIVYPFNYGYQSITVGVVRRPPAQASS
jgi:inorganic pyrophosphatase